MNFYDMRLQFDRIQRTISDASFTEYRDDFLNHAWAKISEIFVIPSLKRTSHVDSVADQHTYQFPYDYNGAEAYLHFRSSSSGTYKRLDPVTEEVLGLMYERRSGNMGTVSYYDWTGCVGEDAATRTCTLANNSTTVLCVTAAAGDVDKWVRFDPFTVGVDTYDPGDYGYNIESVTAGVSYTLDRTYRGPAGDTTGRLRPSEQQQFIVYGSPASAVTDAFKFVYYSNPRRLYNNADVPEWPNMGLAVVYMAISIGYDYMHYDESARIWFGRSMNTVKNLSQRRKLAATLTSDLTVGSVSGRRTGPVGISGSSYAKLYR